MFVDRAHTHAAVEAVSATAAAEQPEGWRFVPDTNHPAWVSVGTPVGPGKDTHGTLGPISGKAVGAPNTVQTVRCRNTQTWQRNNVDPGQKRWLQEHC